MSIKAIAFDKDGTLMKFEDFWIPVAEHAVDLILTKLDIGKGESRLLSDSIDTYGDKTGILCYGTYKDISNAFVKTLKTLGISCDLDKMYRLTVDSFHECMRYGKIKPICDDLSDVLYSLKKSGLILALVTADDLHGTEQFLNAVNIADYFDEVCVFDGVHPPKPNPYYLKMICRKYNLKPSEILMVGDTSIDMDFAKNGNVTAVGIAEKSTDRKYLLQYTKYVLGNVSELADFLKKWSDNYDIPGRR